VNKAVVGTKVENSKEEYSEVKVSRECHDPQENRVAAEKKESNGQRHLAVRKSAQVL
jgi:hypothetical protein